MGKFTQRPKQPTRSKSRAQKGQKFKRRSDGKVFFLERQELNGALIFQGLTGSFDPSYFTRL